MRFHVPFELEEDHSFLDLVRAEAIAVFSAPYFCFDVLRGHGLLGDESWADLGYPDLVHLVVKPTVLDWTENLFDAIEDGNFQDVERWLSMGQDPDCTMIDSALCAAAERNQHAIVQLLIKARANVNYIPMGRPGPLQTAVIHDSEECASLLLRKQANPNLFDGTEAANTPLHLAAVYGDAPFTAILLAHGADPLLRNAYGSCAVALATPGAVVALCLAECSTEADAATILLRHASTLATMGCPASFWTACKALHHLRQDPYADLEGGSQISAAFDSSQWDRLCQNRARALEKKRKLPQDCTDVDLDRLIARGLMPSQIDAFLARRHDAVKRRCWHHLWEKSMPTSLQQRFGQGCSTGIRLPLAEDGWTPQDLGCMPAEFLATGSLHHSPRFEFLKQLNPHERDDCLVFDELSHTYYVDGSPLDVSVTGFIAAFQQPFDAETVISRMQQKSWPRPEYFTFTHMRKAVEFAKGVPELWPLLSLLQAQPVNTLSICCLLQQAPKNKAFGAMRYLLTMTPAEIQAHWKQSGVVASRLGTWAHLQCECLLNAGQVANPGPEMVCLENFLQSSERLIAHRTEWSIWATEEKLAGTIDFCATDSAGCLVLIDWKRSKNLKKKYLLSFKSMKGELSHIPDAIGWKYRLQLNVYKYIIEKYYGFTVSRMFVVDIHPDAAEEPFVDLVPNMQAEVQSILATRIDDNDASLLEPMLDIQGGATGASQETFREMETEEDAALAASIADPEAEEERREVQVKREREAACPIPRSDGREVPESQAVEQDCKDEMQQDLGEEIIDGETVAKIKRRRLLRGVFTSASDFQDLLQGYQEIAGRELVNLNRDCATSEHSTLERSHSLRAMVRAQKPTWSQDMVRIGAAMVAVSNMRLSDRMFVGDSAFLLWMIEGNSTIRVHSGFCYIYNDDGAFLPYSGTPPEAILSRVSLFCTILEGAFRRLPQYVSLALNATVFLVLLNVNEMWHDNFVTL